MLAERFGERGQRIAKAGDLAIDVRVALDLRHRALCREAIEREPHALDREVQRIDRRLQHRERTGDTGAFGLRIAGELGQLARRQRHRKELARELRNLVRFVEDERVRAGQDLAEAFLLDRKIGEQEMMIDDDDVGFLRRAPSLDDEAVVEQRTLGAEAVLGGRRHARPERRILRHVGELGAIAASACASTTRGSSAGAATCSRLAKRPSVRA